MKIKVLMIDDHSLFRDGMRYVFQQLADEVEVFDTGDIQHGFDLARANLDFDLALLDLNMPGSNGVSTAAHFHRTFPGIPLVVVSGADERASIERVMSVGAMGFISKMSAGKDMLAALRLVLDGGIYLPPQLLAADKRIKRSVDSGLTERQLEVLKLMCTGATNKDIAQTLALAESTVKTHVGAIYNVLQVNKRWDAVETAVRLQLVDPSQVVSYGADE